MVGECGSESIIAATSSNWAVPPNLVRRPGRVRRWAPRNGSTPLRGQPMLNPITEDHARLPSGPVRRHPVTAPGLCNTDKPELRPLAPDPSFGPGATCLACPIRQEAPSNSCTAHRRKHAGRRLDVLNQSPGFAYEFAHFASESD